MKELTCCLVTCLAALPLWISSRTSHGSRSQQLVFSFPATSSNRTSALSHTTCKISDFWLMDSVFWQTAYVFLFVLSWSSGMWVMNLTTISWEYEHAISNQHCGQTAGSLPASKAETGAVCWSKPGFKPPGFLPYFTAATTNVEPQAPPFSLRFKDSETAGWEIGKQASDL